jgi:hypothetical protein
MAGAIANRQMMIGFQSDDESDSPPLIRMNDLQGLLRNEVTRADLQSHSRSVHNLKGVAVQLGGYKQEQEVRAARDEKLPFVSDRERAVQSRIPIFRTKSLQYYHKV